MSMNIEIFSERVVIGQIAGIPVPETITEHFDVWQTPTKVTYAILEAADPLEAYKEWVRSLDQGDQVEPEKVFHLGGGTQVHPAYTYNTHKDHIRELEAWVAEAHRKGCNIKVEMI